MVTLDYLRVVHAPVVLGDVLWNIRVLLVLITLLEMVITHMPHVARSAASLPP